jgi:SAM-dependent methyltransferase
VDSKGTSTDASAGLPEYYSRRAAEYESIYQRPDPARAAELASIGAEITRLFRGRRVLELACGTGYWTQRIAAVAEFVLGLDASEGMLAQARTKSFSGRVELRVGDAYAPAARGAGCDAALANFWFSHVPKARVGEFLDALEKQVKPGSVIFMADNMLVEGVGGELEAGPDGGDSFKKRTLQDGTEFRVLKNYFDAEALRGIFGERGEKLRLEVGKFYWWVSYRTKG